MRVAGLRNLSLVVPPKRILHRPFLRMHDSSQCLPVEFNLILWSLMTSQPAGAAGGQLISHRLGWNESIIFSLEILSLYWNSLPFRGGSIVSLPIRFKRRVRVNTKQ